MKSWRCADCGARFEEPVRVPDGQRLEYWGRMIWKDDSYDGCPECDSWDIEERVACAECEDADPAAGDDYCPACRARLDAEEPNWLRPQAW
jgi:hypothetical protein